MSDEHILKVDLPAGTRYILNTSRKAVFDSLVSVPITPSGRPSGPPVNVTLSILKSVKEVIEFLDKGSSTRVSVERGVLVGLLKDLVSVINMACTEEIKLESSIKVSQYNMQFIFDEQELIRLGGDESRGLLNSMIETHVSGQLPRLLADHAVLNQSVDHTGRQHRYLLTFFLGKKIDP